MPLFLSTAQPHLTPILQSTGFWVDDMEVLNITNFRPTLREANMET